MTADLQSPIYLDHHATTPVDPAVLEAMLPYFTHAFGNASSKDHVYGAVAHEAVERARGQVAKLLGARDSEIVFTSGATEANNLALLGAMEANAERGDHLITCVTEHKAILDTARRLERLGKRVTWLPVDRHGMVDPDTVRAAITPQTVMVSIMAANNEIGTLAPVAEIGRITREAGVLFHTDATQAVGNVPVAVNEQGIDLLSLSAHKLYGPKGVGALYVRRRSPFVRLEPTVWGGGHERGLRSGTLNVPGIVGLGAAAELAGRLMATEPARQRALRDRLLAAIEAQVADVEFNGHPTERLPHNLNLHFPAVEAKNLVMALPDLAFSTGAACTSEKVEPSHVLLALGGDPLRAHRSIRLGLGRGTSEAEVDLAAERVGEAVRRLGRVLGLPTPAV